MKPSRYAPVVSYERDSNDGHCYGCDRLMPPNWNRFAFVLVVDYSTRKNIYCRLSCNICADMDEAISAANTGSLRFTEIGIAKGIGVPSRCPNEPYVLNPLPFGHRCICGAVSMINFGRTKRGTYGNGNFCFTCSKENRMLDKAQSQQRLIHKALVQLRREIKTLKETV